MTILSHEVEALRAALRLQLAIHDHLGRQLDRIHRVLASWEPGVDDAAVLAVIKGIVNQHRL